MMKEMLYATDFLEKDVLNLETGDLIGEISGILVEEAPLRVVAFCYRVEDEDGRHLAFCSFDQVTDIDQQVVVISSSQSYLPSEAKNLIRLGCVASDGQVLGRIIDCLWKSSDRQITELVTDGHEGIFGFAVSDIARIGSGAVVLNAPFENLHTSVYQRLNMKSDSSDSTEEVLRGLIRRVGVGLSSAGQKVGERVKQIDTDELNRDINRFTERVGKEIKNVIDGLSEQSKSGKVANIDSEVASVLRDLEGFSVTSPIYDNDGDVIIIPGRLIDDSTVRRTIQNNKIAELYRVAVSISHNETDADAPADMNAPASTGENHE